MLSNDCLLFKLIPNSPFICANAMVIGCKNAAIVESDAVKLFISTAQMSGALVGLTIPVTRVSEGFVGLVN